MKTIKNKVFPFSLKKNKILFFLKKTKKAGELFFLIKNGLFSTLRVTAIGSYMNILCCYLHEGLCNTFCLSK